MSSSTTFRRWVRLSAATITSTALLGGVVIAAPAHPLLPSAQVASAQTAPAEAQAYAFAEQLNLSAPALRDLLVTDDERGVDEILSLLEAEQAWEAEADNDQEPVVSDIQVQLLELLELRVGGITIPLIGEGGLLQGELGALRSFVNAPAPDEARAATGLITDTGALDLSGTGDGGNASLDLTTVLGLDDALAPLLEEASLNLGALSSSASVDNGDLTSDYQIAEAELVIDAPVVGETVGDLREVVSGLDDTLNGLLNDDGVLNDVLGLVNGLTELIGTGIEISAEVPVDEIVDSVVAEPLEDASGLVSIDLANGQIRLDLAQLHPQGLNNLPANTPLVSGAQLTQITSTVTSLLTDGAADNPNGLNARLQNVLAGTAERGGLYGTEVQIDLGVLGPLAGVDLRTTLGALLNEQVEPTENEAEYEANPYNYYFLETEGLGGLLALPLDLVQNLLGAVGTVVDGLLFGDDTQEGLLAGLLGNVQDDVISPLFDDLDPLLEGVVQPLANVLVNRQTNTDGVFAVSALELNLLEGALLLPLATSVVTAEGQPDNGGTPGDGDDDDDQPGDGDTPGDDDDQPGAGGSIGGGGLSSVIGSSTNGGENAGSSDLLMRCVASPSTGLAALLAVLGTAAAVGGPVVEPLTRVVSEQISTQLRQLTGGSAVGPQPNWLVQINRGLEQAANSVDSQVIASALFGAGVLAVLFSPEVCGEEKDSLSSQLS